MNYQDFVLKDNNCYNAFEVNCNPILAGLESSSYKSQKYFFLDYEDFFS